MRGKVNIKSIGSAILGKIEESENKITPHDLEIFFSIELSTSRDKIKEAVRKLVDTGELTYVCEYGRTFVVKSFNRPVRVSKRVVLKPSGVMYSKENPEDIVISLKHGAAFGTGQHPTTRLSINGIEYVLTYMKVFSGRGNTYALDIGTGTGILAISSVMIGVDGAIGTDIDPCAIKEAKDNVRENGMEDKIEITDIPLDAINRKFSLITANLRFPTLINISSCVGKILEKNGAAVLSGIKSDEVETIRKAYTSLDFECKRVESEKGWSCVVFIRN
jgi:ribosomal protein L11 methyltransferase